jgi:hypothetical protein
VAASLAPGGFFLATFPSAEAVVGRFAARDRRALSNPHFALGFGTDADSYVFELTGCVPRLEERLVPLRGVCRLAREVGLELVGGCEGSAEPGFAALAPEFQVIAGLYRCGGGR